MKKALAIILLTLILQIAVQTSQAQKQGKALLDSLLTELPKLKEDTNKVNLLNNLAVQNRLTGNYDTSFYYARTAQLLAIKIDYKRGMAYAYSTTGLLNYDKGNYFEALRNALTALKLFGELDDKRGTALSYNNIGLVYERQGNYSEALKNYLTSIKIREETGNKRETAGSYNNIGNIYLYQAIYPKAISNYLTALKINKETGNTPWIIINYSNIGNVHELQGNYAEALKNYFTALKISEKSGNKAGMSGAYGNIGSAYAQQRNYAEALKNYFASLKINESTGDKPEQIDICIGIGNTYIKLNRYAEAKVWLNKSLNLSREIGEKLTLANSYDGLAQIDAALGNYEGAFKNYKLYMLYKDSLINIEDARKLTQAIMQYDFDKKEATAKVEQEKKDVLAQKELQRQKLMRNGFIGGFVIVLMFAVIFFRQRNKTKKQRERAERSEKFKQQFLANMSHEIRTPMNAIIGMTNLTLNTPLNSKQKKYLSGVHKASENLLHIINDILDLSKIEAGKMEVEQIDFSLHDTVGQVMQTLQYRASEKGIELISTIDAQVPEVVIGDPVRLFQVLMNLTGNAVKFTEKGAVQLLVSMESKQRVVFSVIDTGIGISADKIDKIFESFSQAHSSDTRNYGGTGLGLSISKQLVELMGGKITIESRWGSGSTFSFVLNMPEGSVENLQKQTEEIDGSILNGLNILLADDNEDNRIVCCDTLESKAEVSITEALNGQDVLDKLAQQNFDIILMDVQMPVMDGYEATRQIRNMKNDIPIIALTASVIRSDLDKCRAAGMNDYVSKPFKPSQLFAAIAKLTNRELNFLQHISHSPQANVNTLPQHTDLTYLKNFCEGNETKIQKYIKIFSDSVPAFVEKLNAAQSENNFEEIASQVHGFKTKFVMMGMEEARLIGAQLELDCRTEKPEQLTIHKSIAELVLIILAAVKELKNEKTA